MPLTATSRNRARELRSASRTSHSSGLGHRNQWRVRNCSSAMPLRTPPALAPVASRSGAPSRSWGVVERCIRDLLPVVVVGGPEHESEKRHHAGEEEHEGPEDHAASFPSAGGGPVAISASRAARSQEIQPFVREPPQVGARIAAQRSAHVGAACRFADESRRGSEASAVPEFDVSEPGADRHRHTDIRLIGSRRLIGHGSTSERSPWRSACLSRNSSSRRASTSSGASGTGRTGTLLGVRVGRVVGTSPPGPLVGTGAGERVNPAPEACSGPYEAEPMPVHAYASKCSNPDYLWQCRNL